MDNYVQNEIRKDALKLTKDIYKIALSPYTDWKTKVYCNTFFSYLVNPEDVIPDKEQNGFLDDFYLGLIITNDLLKYRKKLLGKILGDLNNLEKIVKEQIPQIENKIEIHVNQIKKFSGYSSLDKFDLENKKVTPHIKNYLKIRANLLGNIAFCYSLIYNNRSEFKRISNKSPYFIDGYLIKLTEYGDFFEIKRIIDCYDESKTEIDMLDSIEFEKVFFNYDEFIEKSGQREKYKDLYNYIPFIFKTLTNVFKDTDCSWELKHEINSALSYLAIIEDIIDDNEAEGFIDDLFILSIVLIDIYNFDEEIILRNLENIKINDLIFILENCEIILKTKKGEILNHLGLQKLLEFYEIRDISKTNSFDKYLNQIILRNSRLKTIFVDLIRIIFPNEKFDGKNKPETLIEQFKKKIEYYQNENLYNLSSEEKIYIDTVSLEELEKITRVSNEICHIDNLKEEFDREYDERIQLLFLRDKILGGHK